MLSLPLRRLVRAASLWVAVVVGLLLVFTTSGVASATPVITNGLVAAWEFSGNANDVSGNGNDGALNGATLTTDRFGSPDSAYSFDGIDDFLEVPTTASIELENSNLSISMWVKLTGSNTQANDLIDKMVRPSSSSTFASSGFILHTLSGSYGAEAGITRFCVANSNIGGRSCFDSTTNIVDGQYHHVAVTKSALDDVKIYIDGQDDGAVLDHTHHTALGIPLSMLIGKRHLDSNFVNGLLDDVYVYNRVLSSAEIATLYSAVPEPSTALLLGIGMMGLGMRRRRR